MKALPKILIVGAILLVSGCVVAPAGPRAGVYVAPGVVAVSPYYCCYGPRFYYGRRW